MDDKADKMSLLNKCRKDGTLPGFAISKMPIPLFESFMSDVNEQYNGVYWAKLQDLVRKAEVYDNFIHQAIPQQQEIVEDVDDGKVVKTFTKEERVI